MELGDGHLSDEQLTEMLKYIDMRRYRDLEAYKDLLGIDIREMAVDAVKDHGKFVWFDMCCGDFQAGQDLIYSLTQDSYGPDFAKKITARGIDIDTQVPGDYRTFGAVITRGNAVRYPLPTDVELVTCLQGLKYIQKYQRKGLEAIEHWYNQLPVKGRLAFDYPFEYLPKPPIEYLQKQLGTNMTFKFNSNFTDGLYIVNLVKPNPLSLVLPKS